ncbi:MAG: 4-(cytidine 5'-diphospho)-2-C-methyl-D-erythritol kinase [Hyphomicrobiaceae bacterium]|jgi:4-diphosphocytidyl-2-C-methyl-D-erythritol kinase
MTGAVIRERARAKVNLTLRVLGRRPDGYHELDSLVAFADVGDDVVLRLGAPPHVVARGPFAAAIDGPNLVTAALQRLAEAEPRLVLGHVELLKNLPVAAGLGGGSADAAALLRAVRAANPTLAGAVDWPGIAARLGADVPVCLANEPAWMTGSGAGLAKAGPLPRMPAVLVNPRATVPPDKTRSVFRALAASPLPPDPVEPVHQSPDLQSAEALVRFVSSRGNDLEAPARAVMPVVGEVLAALTAVPGALFTGLSGSGPTAFALFGDAAAATAATARLASRHPAWWIVATTIG